jgi:osmotically-inducible protein OsmY
MKVFFGLVVGMAIGAAAVWFFSSEQGRSTLQRGGAQAESTGRSTKDAIQEKLRTLGLRPDDIKEELARTGQVVRRKAQEAGQAIADATADARTTAAIKGKLLADPDLSAVSISVNTTAGVVTLSGSVSSPEHIGKAVLLAMESDGVREVVSTLQVRVKNGKI